MSDELIEKIEGYFIRTIYKSNNYMVSLFNSEDGEIVITSYAFDFDLNIKYTLSGKYVNHPKYGFQFAMEKIQKTLPSIKEEIIKYLSSPMFKGVGKKAATLIYDAYGDDVLNMLSEDSSIIEHVNISRAQKDAIIETFALNKDETNESLFKLISLGLSSKEAHLILSHFKEELKEVLETNPYRFYLEVYGINFKRLNLIINNLEFDNKEVKFKEAYIIFIFKEISFRKGDIYLTFDEIKRVYAKQYYDFDEIINICLNDGYLVRSNNNYYLKNDYLDEIYIADFLKDYKNDEFIIEEDRIELLINDLSKLISIDYDNTQIKAIKNFFLNNISLVVGGPGTGKTTVIKAMVDIFKNTFMYNNIVVVAPTGRACKRINEICLVESKTIHSLLRWNKDDNTFVYNESNPILIDAIIIDEFSMVDNSLFAALLKASSKVKKICIIGDDNQLPSIRQGNVLNDLIVSNRFKLTRLDTIHRQRKGNEIITLAGDIVNEKVELDKFKEDVQFIDINHFNKEMLVEMIQNDINEGYSFDDIQVLSPMYRGEYGIDALNLALQNAFNPNDGIKIEKRIANALFRENDKILQLKNRPDDDVYNGDIGTLIEINEKDKTFLIDYNGTYIYYSFDDLLDITLAYAMSVHKCQGSEYSVIYFICSKSHSGMLYKKLIYTAISRAKEKLVIIGDKETFYKHVLKDIEQRKTSLKSYL